MARKKFSTEQVQERGFREWEGCWEEGVPLKEDLWRMVAEHTGIFGTCRGT